MELRKKKIDGYSYSIYGHDARKDELKENALFRTLKP